MNKLPPSVDLEVNAVLCSFFSDRNNHKIHLDRQGDVQNTYMKG